MVVICELSCMRMHALYSCIGPTSGSHVYRNSLRPFYPDVTYIPQHTCIYAVLVLCLLMYVSTHGYALFKPLNFPETQVTHTYVRSCITSCAVVYTPTT